MKDKVFGVLQRVGRSFMLPIAILPVAGLLLGVGSSFTNETTIATYRLQWLLGEGTLLHVLLVIMNKVGSAVFDNLPLIFAVGVAIGMAKREKEVSALSAAIAYLVMNTAINAMLVLNGDILADGSIAADVLEGTVASSCGILTLQTGVFGGIIVGLGVAALHNRFYKIVLPNALSFFGGTRFVPIISTLVYMLVGILLYFVWPPVQNGIYALGALVTGSGYIGTLIFGLIKRALIPFGLHHVFYMPFWQTALGGTMEVGGQLVQGGQNIFFAQLANSAEITHFSADATRYFSGEFIFMIFGLPGAALAMYHCAKPEKKKAAKGLLLSASLTCMLTGITEPLEFSFLFVAPALFAVQVILAGTAYMIAHILNIAVGLTFSGGLLDLFLFGILQGNAKTSWLLIIPVGIVYFLLYYFIFRFLILKFDFKTPGREDDDRETRLYTKADVRARREEAGDGQQESAEALDPVSAVITRGLGGKRNISDVDCCATRLRCSVHDEKLVNDALLKSTGASGVIHKGKGVQVIYGPQVAVIKSELEDYLETAPDELYTTGDSEVREAAGTNAAGAPGEGRRDAGAPGEGRRDAGAPGEGRRDAGVRGESRRDAGTPGENRKGAGGRTESARSEEQQAEDGGAIWGAPGKIVQSILISSPVTGMAGDLTMVPDEAFAAGMMGDGAAVLPTDSTVAAPEDGVISFVFDTKHAVGFETDLGISLLIHVGIDTVKLGGAGFEVLVRNGQKVKKGEPLMRLDLEYLNKHASSLVSPVICTELSDNQKIRLLKEGKIEAGEALFAVDIYEEPV